MKTQAIDQNKLCSKSQNSRGKKQKYNWKMGKRHETNTSLNILQTLNECMESVQYYQSMQLKSQFDITTHPSEWLKKNNENDKCQ